MARGNLLLGKAKGKLGSVVFAQANGEQITRSKPESVKNPKSTGQNTQRAILATIAKDAALLTPIIDHSFANIKYGADSVRYFRKINLGILRNQVISLVGTNYNLTAKGGLAVPNYLKVSEGSLPAFKMSSDGDAVSFYMGNNTLESEENVTVGAFKSAYPYIQGGDQLTLVKIVKTAGSLVDGHANFALKVNRIVFAPNAFDDPNVMIYNNGLMNGDLLDLTKTTNAAMLDLTDGGAGTGIGFTPSGDDTYAAALILSRKVNGKWQRSTQFMELCQLDDMANNAAAIASYGATASVSTQNEYLNQAEEGDAVSGMSGAYMGMSVKVGDDVPRSFTVNAGSVEDETVQGAAGTIVAISAQAFAPSGKRVVTVKIDRPDGSNAAHGAKSLNYNVAIAAGTAGLWKVIALYDDGTKAEYHATLAVKA